MRIVVDLQACQNGSRRRGIGRHSMAMTRALIKQGRDHQFIIALSQAFPQTIEDVRKELGDLLPQDAFIIFSVPDSATAADPVDAWRNRAAEIARSYFLERLKPDLVFIPSLNEGFWDETVVSIEKDSRYPSAVTLYDLIPLEDPSHYLGGENDRHAFLRRMDQLRRADLVFPISDYVAQDAIARLGLTPERIVVAHCGVEGQFVPASPHAKPRASLLGDYGITRPYVMTASPLELRKNLEGLIAGFASMSAKVRESHQLVLLGKMNASARDYLTDLARTEGLASDAIVFAGYVPDSDLAALYHACSVFAFPSFSEGFGLPLLEAMACGAPVVGSNRTSIPEVVGREDLLCDPADAVAIGRAIERILTRPDLQDELRDYGPRRAAHFTWEKSAATMLDAFEALHERRGAAAKPETSAATLETGLLKMAYVMPDTPAEHRLSGVNSALAAALADLFDLTIVQTGSAPLGTWIKAVCAVRDVEWFESHADQFDHILYGTDIMADASFRQLMSRHAGDALIMDRLSAPMPDMLVGHTLFDGAQSALLDLDGPGALAAAAGGRLPANEICRLLGQDLALRGGRLFLETDTGLPFGHQLGILPTAASQEAGRAFRARAGVDNKTALIVVVTTHEEAGREIVRQFRQSIAGPSDKRALLLFCMTSETANSHEVTQLPGNVVAMSGDLDPVYRGMVSGADKLALDDRLPVPVTARFTLDAQNVHVLPLGAEQDPGQLRSLFVAGTDTDSMSTATPGLDILRTSNNKAAAERLHSIVRSALPREGTAPSLQDLIRRIPAEVSGIRPDGDDLAQLAASLALNEAQNGAAHLYVDVTTFAAPASRRRVDAFTREWLKALFEQAGRHVRPVYADGQHFVVANQFMAKICGIGKPGLQDYAMVTKAGDHMIGFDLCNSFSDESFEALQTAQRRGLSIDYIVLGGLAMDRDRDLAPLVGLLLSWSRESRLHTHAAISSLPQSEDKRYSVWSVHRQYARVGAMVDAGLWPNVLFCDDSFAETFDGKARIIDLPPAIAEAYARWDAPRHAPAIGTRPSLTASHFGHVVMGHLLGSYSLAIVNRMMARTLERHYPGQVRYLPVETTPIDHTEGVPADEKPQMIELSSRPSTDGRGEIVISQHYPLLVPEGNYSLALAVFVWEESQVPWATIEALSRNFDAVISPTRSVTKALIDSGLSVPVATIGQPIDVDRYAALAASRRPRGKETVFLHVSSSFKRKGVDVLLSAWAAAFTSADKVRLVIKTFPNPHNMIEEQVAALQAQHANLAPIVIVNRDVEAGEMPQYYADADVMVLPTRGEGYNLPALEAMAAGLPLIVTGHGGHRDFCGDREARLVRYRFTRAESHVSGHHSLWAEPDRDDLAAALREQLDPAEAPAIEARRQRAMAAAMRESDVTAWVRRYDTMIGELHRAHPQPARIAWISTWAVQCGIAQYSSYLLEHFSEKTLNQTLVICDTRTPVDPEARISHNPAWEIKKAPDPEQVLESVRKNEPVEEAQPNIGQMLQSVDAHEAEAVVIQHQDGLLSWRKLGQLAHDERLKDKATIVILHNPATLAGEDDDERTEMLEGLRKMSRILVHNLADVNFLSSLGLEHNVGLLPHGAFARDSAPWPRKLGPADAPVIGCHGFFFRHKGIDKLIRAAALLRKEWPNLKLRLVNAQYPGEGYAAYIRECGQLANSLGMADAIEWHQGFLPVAEVDALLAGCDVIALPYDECEDSASGAVRGALASMVPLVCTRVKIFAELGEAAEWSDNNEPDTLADALARLLRSPERRRTVQAATHEWLAAHDWGRVAGTLEGMIYGLVQEKRLGGELGRS